MSLRINAQKLMLIHGFFWGSIQPDNFQSCVGLVQEEAAASIDKMETYESADVKNILFLADGTDMGWGSDTLGERVAKRFPDKSIVRTDLMIVNAKTVGNLITLAVDNTQPFPETLTTRKFDRIVMRDGMCVCCTAAACGGIAYKRRDMAGFIERVSALLNTDNPNAIAVLHARAGRIPSGGKRIIEEAVADVQVRFPHLQFDFNIVSGKIHSLMIRPRAAADQTIH